MWKERKRHARCLAVDDTITGSDDAVDQHSSSKRRKLTENNVFAPKVDIGGSGDSRCPSSRPESKDGKNDNIISSINSAPLPRITAVRSLVEEPEWDALLEKYQEEMNNRHDSVSESSEEVAVTHDCEQRPETVKSENALKCENMDSHQITEPINTLVIERKAGQTDSVVDNSDKVAIDSHQEEDTEPAVEITKVKLKKTRKVAGETDSSRDENQYCSSHGIVVKQEKIDDDYGTTETCKVPPSQVLKQEVNGEVTETLNEKSKDSENLLQYMENQQKHIETELRKDTSDEQEQSKGNEKITEDIENTEETEDTEDTEENRCPVKIKEEIQDGVDVSSAEKDSETCNRPATNQLVQIERYDPTDYEFEKNEDVQPLECLRCFMTFHSQEALDEHQSEHVTNPRQCLICHIHMPSTELLAGHVMRFHGRKTHHRNTTVKSIASRCNKRKRTALMKDWSRVDENSAEKDTHQGFSIPAKSGNLESSAAKAKARVQSRLPMLLPLPQQQNKPTLPPSALLKNLLIMPAALIPGYSNSLRRQGYKDPGIAPSKQSDLTEQEAEHKTKSSAKSNGNSATRDVPANDWTSGHPTTNSSAEQLATEADTTPSIRKSFLCSQCVIHFRNAEDLKSHEERIHQNKDLRCNVCYLEFDSVGACMDHRLNHGAFNFKNFKRNTPVSAPAKSNQSVYLPETKDMTSSHQSKKLVHKANKQLRSIIPSLSLSTTESVPPVPPDTTKESKKVSPGLKKWKVCYEPDKNELPVALPTLPTPLKLTKASKVPKPSPSALKKGRCGESRDVPKSSSPCHNLRKRPAAKSVHPPPKPARSQATKPARSQATKPARSQATKPDRSKDKRSIDSSVNNSAKDSLSCRNISSKSSLGCDAQKQSEAGVGVSPKPAASPQFAQGPQVLLPQNQSGQVVLLNNLQYGILLPKAPAKVQNIITFPAQNIASVPLMSHATVPMPANSIAAVPMPANSIATVPMPAQSTPTVSMPAQSIATVSMPARSIATVSMPAQSIATVPMPAPMSAAVPLTTQNSTTAVHSSPYPNGSITGKFSRIRPSKCPNPPSQSPPIFLTAGSFSHACKQCCINFPTDESLQLHKKRVHDKTSCLWQHACKLCAKTFNTRRSLSLHNKHFHWENNY